MGGVAAAVAAAERGARVVLTEATDWLGGQLTSQAVPLDEHPWIEEFGCTASYRGLRSGIRDSYRAYLPLTVEARANPAPLRAAGWSIRAPNVLFVGATSLANRLLQERESVACGVYSLNLPGTE